MNVERELHAFWAAEERRLEGEVRGCEAGSMRQMVANQFLLGARRQLARFEELRTARGFRPWSFYAMREESLWAAIRGRA